MFLFGDDSQLRRIVTRQDRQNNRLTAIEQTLDAILIALENIMPTLAETLDLARAERTKLDSLVALAKGIATQLRDSAEDPAAINALADEIEAQIAEIDEAPNDLSAPAAPETPA